ncbi:hypothetical protein AK830_g8599 [Neonectria ditissima]|uniref:Calcineurin-like phosphoesterase domain-containing protein n=1 Tax=Neonectria ditissima TaxID=78410 RepID=A0A0P7AK98_9HYPO|nr:hypothetical protein AK830_g8599 [Neonectria ditissima]
MPALSSITLKGHRKRQVARALLAFHRVDPALPSPPNPIQIVCISDTHNKRPELPVGDILIHAGDLTENGSFDEMQAELKWLSDQPHRYKIFVAGNHDVLLDDAFLTKYPKRRYGQKKTKEDLNWGSVIYLQDSCVTLEFPSPTQAPRLRRLTIFGSPWSPQYGVSAFQYGPDDESHWSTRFASLDVKPDIVVTHSPPKHHLDASSFRQAGCPYLAEELAHIRPRLSVFGHIHVSYGREDVVLDGVQRGYEEVMTGWAGWERLCWMAILVLWAKLKWLLRISDAGQEKGTTFVNAALVGGPSNELRNDPVAVNI